MRIGSIFHRCAATCEGITGNGFMRTYVIVVGAIFGVLTVAHVWRMVEEPDLVRDPWFMSFTVAAAVLGLAAWRVARRPNA